MRRVGGAFAELSGRQLWGLHRSQRGNIDSSYLSLSLYDSLGKLGLPQDVIAPIIPMPAHTPSELHSFKLQARPLSGGESRRCLLELHPTKSAIAPKPPPTMLPGSALQAPTQPRIRSFQVSPAPFYLSTSCAG